MAVYKVPQDVEAEDKLIGPFSFRQFIYLIVVAIAIFIGWILSRIFIGLIIIPLPIVIFFGALALPLRKDQPMETYLVGVIRFFLKPRIRRWEPDGLASLVSVSAPKTVEAVLTKSFSGNEAERRLSYLAQIVDTRGWASRGVINNQSSLSDSVAAEAQSAEDILDTTASVGQSFTQLISQTEESRKQQAIAQMRQVAAAPSVTVATPVPAPVAPIAAAAPQPAPSLDASNINYNPYPENMRQHIVLPASAPARAATPAVVPPKKQAVPPAVSPDIIRLANNNDLSISAIAHEAHRLEASDGEEVVISLR